MYSIHSNSESTINDTGLFKFESLNPGILHVVQCVFGFEKRTDVFESIVIQHTLKVTLHCHSHILIWIVEQCGVVFVSLKAS